MGVVLEFLAVDLVEIPENARHRYILIIVMIF